MPSRGRRREFDIRADRFESEVRHVDMARKDFPSARKFVCMKCNRMYEERSRNCPRCDSHTMAEIKRIPDRLQEEARRNAIRRAKAGNGLRLPEL